MTEIRGYHVLAVFVLGFGIIIAANLTLAVNAVRTFPGLEVKNSYVASQKFETAREIQDALNWEVTALLSETHVILRVTEGGVAVEPTIKSAVFGHATSVEWDQELEFSLIDGSLIAPVVAGPGNWNLRLQMVAANGSLFSRRIILEAAK